MECFCILRVLSYITKPPLLFLSHFVTFNQFALTSNQQVKEQLDLADKWHSFRIFIYCSLGDNKGL